MRITLPIALNYGCWFEVEAELVDVAPHLAGTFAVHRGAVHPNKGLWLVTHLETGGQASPAKPTKALAIAYATKYLAEKTPRDFAIAVRRFMKNEPLASEIRTLHEEWECK